MNRHKLWLRSQHLGRIVKVEVYLPSETSKYRGTLILNDGQDRDQLHLVKHFSILLSKVEIPNIGIVTVYADENRMQEYGVAGHPDFKKRGKVADKYSNFIVQELTPFLQTEYGLMNPENKNVFA
ncbi:alpha/beta hydrolase-fold protein [Antarcticibacterium sp. 1MA-6-2]|uniref:alpha/beta hydrolase-fold protein n=1 Tax=Antarcticibacterium sp. 1MA-6-2 TaxID=2908210 RepID=UPI00210800BB|nr:alpha/beta hydrolase-fold protein [Antarcticibacterium sp. 1MA-6-2]